MFSFIQVNESAGRIQMCWPMVYLYLINREKKTLGFLTTRWMQMIFQLILDDFLNRIYPGYCTQKNCQFSYKLLICFYQWDTDIIKYINIQKYI